MRTYVLSAVIAGLLGLGVMAPAAAQDHAHHAPAAATPAPDHAQHASEAVPAPQHAHDHAQHAPDAAATPAPAQRWATDAPLRKGMADIRGAVQALGHYEMGHMGPEQALQQVATIEQSIGYLIANCKLDPQADAALHGIIGQLGQGIAALKADPQDLAAIATLRSALQEYPRLFDDPDWPRDAPAAE